MENIRDDNLWIFNAGTAFSGNPKWLFIYLEKNHPEIKKWWFCYDEETLHTVKSLGFKACLYKSKEAEKIGKKAGVYVVEQNKIKFEDFLKDIKVLNLWHGVGCKNIENSISHCLIEEEIVRKNIINKTIYRQNQQFLVTSEFMEEHFVKQCGLDRNRLIRSGYPRNINLDGYASFDHNKVYKGNPNTENLKLAIYAPTYRDFAGASNFFKAIPDIEKLITVLEKTNTVMIFKMHPKTESEQHFLLAKEKYQNSPWLYFWDNQDDVYEIMDKIDYAIIDYSSIFYDFMAKGVKKFIRYFYDIDDPMAVRDSAYDYRTHTCGTICNNYEELIKAIENKNYDVDESELNRINELFWGYSKGNSLEDMISSVLNTNINSEELPTLYSFDIFDTLISRKCLEPKTVFYYVKEKLQTVANEYPEYVVTNFQKIRPWAENNCREYYRKSELYRKTDHIEISLDMIYDRIQELYGISDKQKEQIKEWELECEYETSIPCTEKINYLKSLVEKGEKVVLISDMYLPESFIKKMLAKADPVLESIPLFLSSTYGVQKTTKKLFFEVFHFVDYNFGKWIHYGDNPKADGALPASLGIVVVNHKVPELNVFEKQLNDFAKSYNTNLVTAMMARYRFNHPYISEFENFCFSSVSLYLVPYIAWVIEDSVRKGIKTLYFTLQNGYYLYYIAETYAKQKGIDIEIKLLYFSNGTLSAYLAKDGTNTIESELFEKYLLDNIAEKDDIAFVDYSGLGIFQEELCSVLSSLVDKKVSIPFYYVRSVLPSKNGYIRHNFTANSWSLDFMDNILFAEPFDTILQYQVINDVVVPVLPASNSSNEIVATLKNQVLEFTKNYTSIVFTDCGSVNNSLYDFALSYYHNNIKKNAQIAKHYKLFNSCKNKCDVEKFIPENKEIVSFDLISGLLNYSINKKEGIYSYIIQKVYASSESFPQYVVQNFFKIRPWAETKCRKFYNSAIHNSESIKNEITLDMIYSCIKDVFGLTDEQAGLLKRWEFEGVLNSLEVNSDVLILAEKSLEENKKVLIIEDSIYHETFVREIISKYLPSLIDVPLYLSNKFGLRCDDGRLFSKVYELQNLSAKTWIHYSSSLQKNIKLINGIEVKIGKIEKPGFNKYEQGLVEFTQSYDAYKIAHLFAKFRNEDVVVVDDNGNTITRKHTIEEIYAYCYVSFYFVPYINWVLDHAIQQGYETLYFISRDGYHLKRIADSIIQEKQLNIKTKYIYGSRRAWRIPSQVNAIDDEFFSEFGNFNGVTTFGQLLVALSMDEVTFDEMFPNLSYIKNYDDLSGEMNGLRTVFSGSQQYRQYLLKVAKEKRGIVNNYLKQEINFEEKFAFVEYWGRGYTQTCLANLINDAIGKEIDNPCYYARTIYPTHGKVIRYNFTGNNWSLIFVETIFANLPQETVPGYKMVNNEICPILVPSDNNELVHNALETYLPLFASHYCKLQLNDERTINKEIWDYGVSYFNNHKTEKIFVETFNTLVDSADIYGSVHTFNQKKELIIPKITVKDAIKIFKGKKFKTDDFEKSLEISSGFIKFIYNFYKNIGFFKKIVKFNRKKSN